MKKLLVTAAFAFTLSACANSSLTVERPYSGTFRTTQAIIAYDESTVGVSADDVAYTQRRMEEAFFGGDTPLFERGAGITARYRYIGFNEGSQLGRYLTGGLAGGSKVVLEVDFVDAAGTILSTVRGEGTVAGGFFGGSNKTGIDKAIDEVADYAAARFHR